MFFIYRIDCLKNGKSYIGQTHDLARRLLDYKKVSKPNSRNKNKQQTIVYAMRKHGFENFTFNHIETCQTQEAVDAAEIRWIAELNTLVPNGYNVMPGGKGGKQPESSKKKISEGVADYWKGKDRPGTRNGHKSSDEHRKRISKSLRGKSHLSNRRFSEKEEKTICEEYLFGLGTHKLSGKYNCSNS